MATINSKGQLSGTVGGYSFRVVNGKAIVQSKPGKNNMKQTDGTKSSASEFGIANSTAKKIRSFLLPIIQNLADPKMHNRFAVKIYEAVLAGTSLPKGKRTFAEGDLNLLSGFQFNSNSPFQKFATFSTQASLNNLGQVKIALPEITASEQLYFPENASGGMLCYLVTAVDKDGYNESYSEVFKVAVPERNSIVAPQEWSTPELPADHIVFVSRAIFFHQNIQHMGATVLNSKKLHPAEVVSVFKTAVV